MTEIGECTFYQINEMMKDLCEIKKMEAGEDQKDPENMTAQEKIDMYKRQGKL
tara:strand:- start:79 stop:237 length:159 start_codon:yes stop_codon:yes gene_type:complete